SKGDLERVLVQLASSILPSPMGSDRVGINYGLHLTGGEPFLNFELLVEGVEMAESLGIPSIFVETNAFWCSDDESVREKFIRLRKAGLDGVLVSVNPFILEQVPFERTVRAIKVGREVFGVNVIVYQDFFHWQFKLLSINGRLSFEEYLRKVGVESLEFVELIPMGRAVYSLGHLFHKFPAEYFFKECCRDSLTRDWHVHIDNYCNYMAGYCGGISLGDARRLDSIYGGIELEEYPILECLVTGLEKLYTLGVKEFGYNKCGEGYISKCHLCLDIRKHIAQKTKEFKELSPREFYFHL
ncbi:MAG: hypothetical protein QXO71_05240, partial [Candidatus Jordarchaeaceae archaeon]